MVTTTSTTARENTSERTVPTTTYLLWTAQVVAAAIFLFAGSMKFIMSAEEMTREIAFPLWFLRFIGVAEVLGGLALILPGIARVRRALTPIAAAGLVIIMVGAVLTTLVAMGALAALWPLGVGLLTAIVVYGRRAWLSERSS